MIPREKPWETWIKDDTYPIGEFGWSTQSTVFLSGGESIIEVHVGESLEIPIKAIYVHRDDGRNNPKAVTLRMRAADSCELLKLSKTLSQEELLQKAYQCESGEAYDRALFFNTANLVSFTNIHRFVRLNDRVIRTINMKVTIPLDLPVELRRTIKVMPSGSVNPATVGVASRGVFLKIID